MNEYLKKKSDLGTMKGLGVGESADFPTHKICTIRSNASTINIQRGYKSLSTKLNRESQVVTVTRIA